MDEVQMTQLHGPMEEETRIRIDDDDANALTSSQTSRSFNEIYNTTPRVDQDGSNSKSLPKIRFAVPESTSGKVPSSSSSSKKAGRLMSFNLKKRATFNENASSNNNSECNSPGVRTPRTSQHSNVALFRTKTRLNRGVDRQISRLREKQQDQQAPEQLHEDHEDDPQEQQEDVHDAAKASDHDLEGHPVPARRYFDALRGPELDELQDWENALLPRDKKWPFLLRFPISSFGIVLGLGSQSILWKQLSQAPSIHLFQAPEEINKAIWYLAVVVYSAIAFTYLLKMAFYFEAVRREYYHPVRINFFFAPWIAAMFLALGVPRDLTAMQPKPWTWCILMAPVVSLELKIYGQWLSGGERRLSKIANPSTHLSVVGNFVGALLGASVGWKEGGLFFWSIGLAHYLVLFVTLYQRLPTNETLPKDLHPVFFLFVAAPSAASVAWEKITGEFGLVSRVVFFIALFLFSSLVVRISFFRGFKFSLAWWAYTFPMTALSIACIKYSQEVTNLFTEVLAIGMSCISSLTVLLLFLSTMCHLLYWRTLFPNDMAIAITHKKKNSKSDSSNGGFGSHIVNMFSGLANGKVDNAILEGDTRGVCTEV